MKLCHPWLYCSGGVRGSQDGNHYTVHGNLCIDSVTYLADCYQVHVVYADHVFVEIPCNLQVMSLAFGDALLRMQFVQIFIVIFSDSLTRLGEAHSCVDYLLP